MSSSFFFEKIDVVQIAVVHFGLKKELSSSLAVVQIYSLACNLFYRIPGRDLEGKVEKN